MTWSLIALDPTTADLGLAGATRFFSGGARVPFLSSGHGAIATQALVNPYYGIDGLQLLREGHTPAETLGILLKADTGRNHRQVHIVGKNGETAAHTGSGCLKWAGHRLGDCFSAAGNM